MPEGGKDVVALSAHIDSIGGKWMGQPVMAVGAELGLEGYPWPFYMVGRGGVLGDVAPEVVAAAMVFPSPTLVEVAWRRGRAMMGLDEAVRRFIDCGYGWAREHLAEVDGRAAMLELTTRLVEGLGPACAPLAMGWRAVMPPVDESARIIFNINVLREHRGGLHAAAVIASGLSPLEAIMATEGESMAEMYGWVRPYPDREASLDRKAPAEVVTNELVAASFVSLSPAELNELARLLEPLA